MQWKLLFFASCVTIVVTACVFDFTFDDGGSPGFGLSSSTPVAQVSSCSVRSSSSMSRLDSLYQRRQEVLDSIQHYRDSMSALDSLAQLPDTIPTWAVPFGHTVTRTAVNPVGRDADPILAALGTKRVVDIIDAHDWDVLFPYRAGVHPLCDESVDFYTYQAFILAVADFPAFAGEGPDAVRKREVSAFLAQVSHETTGGSGSFATGSERYKWGLCFTEEHGYASLAYRDEDHPIWPPSPGKSYHGRGPIQLTWNYNYGAAGDDLGLDLLGQPELVLETGANAFRTALWFWMKEQYPKPSPHDAMVETWAPTAADKRNNRWPGFGVVTNIVNGGGECGTGSEGKPGPKDRMGFFARYAPYLGTNEGRNVDCTRQHDFTFQ